MAERVTRGDGLLEGFLARKRAAMARRLLRDVPRDGRILDIGCGSHPLFLLGCGFRECFGVDQLAPAEGTAIPGGRLLQHRIGREPLPFPDAHFDAVTMLAVFEHVPPHALGPLLTETRRVLREGGTLVITTPAAWTDPILRTLAALRLVSREEIEEHQDSYSQAEVRDHLVAAGFPPHDLRSGTFELGMNLWIRATR